MIFISRLAELDEPVPSASWWFDQSTMKRYQYVPGTEMHVKVGHDCEYSWLCTIERIVSEELSGRSGYRAYWSDRRPVTALE